MKSARLIILFLFYTLSFVRGDGVSEIQNWTREEDKKSISASLLSFDLEMDVVSLKLKNGRTVDIKISILIPEHRARLENLEKEMKMKKEAASKPRLTSHTPEGEGGYKVHIYKPAGYIDNSPSSETRPIAFLYSPGGRSIDILNRLKVVSDELGWVLIGVDAYKNTKSLEDRYEERMKNTKIAFEWVEENVSFDPGKIVFGGLSGGGWWAFQSASDLTKKAAGILSFGGWMGNMHDKRYSRKMAVAIVNGDKDKGAGSAVEKDTDFLTNKAGCKVKIFQFPGGHVLAPSDTALEAAKWIHKTKKFGTL